jgi:hypothetical protein
MENAYTATYPTNYFETRLVTENTQTQLSIPHTRFVTKNTHIQLPVPLTRLFKENTHTYSSYLSCTLGLFAENTHTAIRPTY